MAIRAPDGANKAGKLENCLKCLFSTEEKKIFLPSRIYLCRVSYLKDCRRHFDSKEYCGTSAKRNF